MKARIRLDGIRVRTAQISTKWADEVLICLWCRHVAVSVLYQIVQRGLWGDDQVTRVCWCDWCRLASVFVITKDYQQEALPGKVI